MANEITPEMARAELERRRGADSGVTPEMARAELERRGVSTAPEVKPLNPFSVNPLVQSTQAMGELGLSAVTGLAGQVAGGIAGLVGGGTLDERADRVRNVQSNLTYQPRAGFSRQVAGAVGKPFEAIEEGVDRGAEIVGKPGGPFLQTLLKTGVMAIPEVLGGRRPKAVPRKVELARKAQDKGYVVNPAATNPTATTAIAEGLGGTIKTRQAADNINQINTNRLVREELGIGSDVPLSRDALEAVRANAGQKFEALRGVGEISVDQKFFNDVEAIKNKFSGTARDFPKLSKQASGNFVDIADEIGRKASFDSNSAVTAIRQIRNEASKAFRAGDDSLGAAYKDLANTLESAVERDLAGRGVASAEIVSEFRKARETIAKTHSVEDALVGEHVSAPKLAQQANKGRPLSGNLADIAEFSNEFPLISRVPKDGVKLFSPLDLFSGAGGMSAGSVAGALTGDIATSAAAAAPFLSFLARPSLRSLALSGAGQKAARSTSMIPSNAAAGLLATSELARAQNEDDR